MELTLLPTTAAPAVPNDGESTDPRSAGRADEFAQLLACLAAGLVPVVVAPPTAGSPALPAGTSDTAAEGPTTGACGPPVPQLPIVDPAGAPLTTAPTAPTEGPIAQPAGASEPGATPLPTTGEPATPVRVPFTPEVPSSTPAAAIASTEPAASNEAGPTSPPEAVSHDRPHHRPVPASAGPETRARVPSTPELARLDRPVSSAEPAIDRQPADLTAARPGQATDAVIVEGADDTGPTRPRPGRPDLAGPSPVASLHAAAPSAVARSAAAAPPAPTPAPPTTTSPVAEQLSLRILDVVRSGEGADQEVSIQLDPAELGRVDLRIRVTGEVVHVHLSTEHGATADLVRQSLPELRSALDAAGLATGGLDVGAHLGQTAHGWAEHGTPDQPVQTPAAPRPADHLRARGPLTATTAVDVLL